MILVYTEQQNGIFKKAAYEAISYAANIAQSTGAQVCAVVLGEASGLETLGNYGAQQVVHVNDARLNKLEAKACAKAICSIANAQQADIIIFSNNNTAKAVAPRVAAQLKAGLVAGAVSLPDLSQGFVVKKSVFSGKAFAFVQIKSAIKVISLTPNAYGVNKTTATATVSNHTIDFASTDFAVKVISENKVQGIVPLGEAELVVSGGRGLKGPENWGILEELAGSIGATLACSRPVADSHWRPHHEHVGQTGGTIRPNLYIAVGISGAIQHLAGVNSSKTIVVINKDAEAPFFKAADYGVLGDAFEIVPKLTAAFKKMKASQQG
ncbi:MAG: electron transfer flavoprotein subunit alpha/FixB family protein [Bacteroidetes bacterium]|jgi:electron transfer flavoprotein alpha subunit|nr:electron transfer flavoprotein subunit alpha/FixB family protein [Bacteroidota bacterium]MBK9302223.1 electron transfer flavoprotein subunit alpha/FixB family protein [Bacteroidota bacterium]MBK9482071.1 electron transfer flavoprotein subunit alpha/FixB family protein [Bacteroidota bacterium]